MIPTLADLETLARQAGEILRAAYTDPHEVRFKGEIDLVTEADHRAEAFLLAEIRRKFPGHSIVAEESGHQEGDRQSTWYVDPLDGTVNFAHGIPLFAVSIAYQHQGELVLGAVYEPLRQECFTARRAGGAWLNGAPIEVSSARDLGESLLVTGFPYDVRTTQENNLAEYARFTLVSQGVRRLGSAALDLCYVACGRVDGFWELSLGPWDVAAGALIAREAGARVTNLHGGADLLVPPYSILAAPPAIHSQMLAVLNQA